MLDSHQGNEEARLIRVIQVGSPSEAREAFEALYASNDTQLRRYLAYGRGLQEFEIDEVCSIVWERAIENIRTYMPTGVPYFIWLKKTANFVILENNRKRLQALRRTEPISDDFDMDDVSDWSKDPLLQLLEAEEELEAAQKSEEIKGAVRQVIQQLPPNSQEVLVARNELGLSAQETGDELNWTVKKVYSEYNRAQKRLKATLLKTYGKEHVATWLGKGSEDLSV